SGGLRLAFAARGTDVLVDEVLDHEQRRRPVVELFALVHADVDAHLAAPLADALGLGQLVVHGLTGQVFRHTTAAVRSAPPFGLRRRCWFGWRHGRVLARARLNEEEEVVGVDAFAARPVQAL